MNAEECLDAHLERIIEASKNLFLQSGSICKKCHATHGDIYCILCYCPLYNTDCGGNYTILDNGVKDCSGCVRSHTDIDFIKSQLKRIYHHEPWNRSDKSDR